MVPLLNPNGGFGGVEEDPFQISLLLDSSEHVIPAAWDLLTGDCSRYNSLTVCRGGSGAAFFLTSLLEGNGAPTDLQLVLIGRFEKSSSYVAAFRLSGLVRSY